ncbi:MAG: transporter substrate-binding domain-containing protein [Pseudomonadota bacterium]
MTPPLRLIVLLLCCPLAQAETPLRFLTVEGHALPLAQIRRMSNGQSELTDGIIKDWQDALARELGRRPVDVVLPRKRQDLAVTTKQVDLRCFVSPEWLTGDAIAQYDWPAPFLEVEERVVGASGAERVNGLDDLDKKTIGTVHGYQYRKLDPLFAAGRAKREDAPSESALMLKQLAGRTDVAVMRTLDFYYLQRNDPRLAQLALSPLVVSRFGMYCARPKYSSVTLQDLNAAQERMVKAGTMDKILLKYR